MSKNIFSVLAHDDSDDEMVQKTTQVKTTKKTQRKKDRFLRDTFGDQAPKENHQRGHHQNNKRNNDRHSKRGNQAYGNQNRKGGYGKTNVGNDDLKNLENKTTDVVNKELNEELGEVVVEPKVEIVTLDQYMSQNNQKFGFLNKKPVVQEESKGKKKKNLDSLITNTNNIAQETGYTSNYGGYNKYSHNKKQHGGKKKRNNLKYDDVNFPSLG